MLGNDDLLKFTELGRATARIYKQASPTQTGLFPGPHSTANRPQLTCTNIPYYLI